MSEQREGVNRRTAQEEVPREPALLPRGCWQPRPSVRAVDGVRGVDSLPWPPDLMGLSPQGKAGVWGSQVGWGEALLASQAS